MNIQVAKSAGFCFGVNRAVDLVYELAKNKSHVKTLGPIIHNSQLVEDLSQKGVQIIDTPSEADEQDTVVIRSHGVGQEVYEALSSRQIAYVDATCPFVSKIHKIVRKKSLEGNVIIIAGDKDHPEVLGIKGHSVGETYVIKDENELVDVLKSLKENGNKPAVLVAQTTFNTTFWEKCVESAKKLYTNLIFFDTICNATNERQTEAIRLAKENDLMIVIGGKHRGLL